MLIEFIDFVDSVLPSVDPDFRDGAKNAILQFERTGEQLKYTTLSPLGELSQGDIISKVPSVFFDDNGDERTFSADALVLTTSCHIDNKDKIVLVPVLPLESFQGDMASLQKNTIFDFMYIPDAILSDKFISFEYLNTYSKNLIFNGINAGKIKRVSSLNNLGYYFFVVKLSVFFMKIEDVETLKKRNAGFAY